MPLILFLVRVLVCEFYEVNLDINRDIISLSQTENPFSLLLLGSGHVSQTDLGKIFRIFTKLKIFLPSYILTNHDQVRLNSSLAS